MIDYYVLKYPDGSFVAIDKILGGFPRSVDNVFKAEFFTLNEAKKYSQICMGEEFLLFKATIILTGVRAV